jgi:hypothetical protein
MTKKYSVAKEYDEYVDYLYLRRFDMLIKRHAIMNKDIPDELLHDLKDKAKDLSVTTSFTMHQSEETVFEPLKLTCSIYFKNKARKTMLQTVDQ